MAHQLEVAFPNYGENLALYCKPVVPNDGDSAVVGVGDSGSFLPPVAVLRMTFPPHVYEDLVPFRSDFKLGDVLRFMRLVDPRPEEHFGVHAGANTVVSCQLSSVG